MKNDATRKAQHSHLIKITITINVKKKRQVTLAIIFTLNHNGQVAKFSITIFFFYYLETRTYGNSDMMWMHNKTEII